MIQGAIEAALREKRECNVMLTGGRSAEKLYVDWAKMVQFRVAKGVRFYFGDERCVPPDHPESNYAMAVRTLFAHGVPEACSVIRMEAEDPDREAAARRYEAALPENIDILLLGVGEDGHIASLFAHSPALLELDRRVVAVSGAKRPHDRLTITPPVIAKAKSIFVLAAGEAKARVFAQAVRAPDDVAALPARLVLRAKWLLDAPTP